jgi:hypothetical protein
MAVWSVMKVSELEGFRRLDAEHYRPEYLKLNRFLSKHPPLGQYVDKIIHPVEIKRVYEEQGLHILLAQNIQRNFLEFSVTVFMPESVRELILRNKLIPNDVVMTRSGANYGDAAPYFGEPAPLYACADDLVIRPKSDLLAGYLATFFNTDSGRTLIKRGGYGAGQPHIAPPFLKTLHIPRFSRDVEQKVDDLVRLARDEFKKSEALYLQAERMVLKEIGWDKLDLSQSKWWTAPLSRAEEVHRIDAEHFQPKHDKLIAQLMRTGKTKFLGEIAPFINHGPQPPYSEVQEIPVVTQRHMGRYILNFDLPEEFTTKVFWESKKKFQIREQDILFYSVGAYLGRTNLFLSSKPAMAGSYITIIRPNYKECLPEYLTVYLNAMVGQMQSDKHSRASGQQYIYPSDIARFLIYLPSERFQQRMADLAQQSYQAHQKAKALLEEAKAEIEALIQGRGD